MARFFVFAMLGTVSLQMIAGTLDPVLYIALPALIAVVAIVLAIYYLRVHVAYYALAIANDFFRLGDDDIALARRAENAKRRGLRASVVFTIAVLATVGYTLFDPWGYLIAMTWFAFAATLGFKVLEKHDTRVVYTSA